MLSLFAIYGALVFVCCGALVRPYIGVLGYYAFVLLQPEWNWRWHFPEPVGFQKYITAATLIGTMLNFDRKIPFSPLVSRALLAMSGFVGVLFLSYSNSIKPVETWNYVDSLWKIFLMVLLAIFHLDSSKKCLQFMWTLVICQGFNAYRINEDYFLNGVSSYRTAGYGLFGDNNLYSGMTLPIWGIAVALVFSSRTTFQRLLAGGIMLLQAHQIMLLESRGAMLGAVLVSPVILWYMPKTKLNISALVVGVLGIAALAGPSVVEEFLSIRGDQESGTLDASAESRYSLWKAGFQITTENPLLGVGPWAGQYLVPSVLGKSGTRKGLHNIFFEISAGCGVPGALLYFGFFGLSVLGSWYILRKLSKVRKLKGTLDREEEIFLAIGLATVVGLISYFAASMFSAGALLEGAYAVAALGLCGYSCFLASASPPSDESSMEWAMDAEDGLEGVGDVEQGRELYVGN